MEWDSLKTIRHAHFMGIGGIGMSALAQLFAHEGITVSGSDRDVSPTTAMLTKKGIPVNRGHAAQNVPQDCDVLIYSDAVSPDNPERAEATRRAIAQFSYFQMLGKVSAGKRTVAVAGTHGKTTTTGMLAKILIDAGVEPTVVVGSLVKDLGGNYVAGHSDWFVVEACEYHDHLLELSPEILVITNLEWDHTDYFPSLAALQETFRKAISRVPSQGVIITNPKSPHITPLLGFASARIVDYTREPAYKLQLPGGFNQDNARATAAAARAVVPNITDEAIATALQNFHGTWRRFEYKGKTANGADVYDDYAHHPTAIRETLKTLRAQTSGKVYVAFHPHLYSRTRDLFEDFAASFTDADRVLIAPIYAAREEDDGSISSEKLAAAVRAHGVQAQANSFGEIERVLASVPRADDAIMTMGAGDIYKVADALVTPPHELR